MIHSLKDIGLIYFIQIVIIVSMVRDSNIKIIHIKMFTELE